MSDDLRSTIEAATQEVEANEAPVQVESSAPVETSAPVSAEVASVDTSAPAGTQADTSEIKGGENTPPSIEEVAGAEGKSVEDKTETAEQKAARDRVDRAPVSWKGESKKVWDQLPLNVRQEVVRREREITKTLNETAQVRQTFSKVDEIIRPHMDRINTIYGGDALQAINNLMGVERTLVSGDPMSKAQLVANMINHFKVDLITLDRLLSGQDAPPEVKQQSSLEQLIEQKLAPFNQFLQTQQQREQQKAREVEEEVVHTIESMASDPKYPYFNEVRADMADLIDIAAKKGLYLSLEQAYSKAVRMNDGVFEASSVRSTTQAATQAALQAHQEAQKAKGAAVSVGGAPSSPGVNVGNPNDLRGTILAALGDTGRL